MLRGMQMFALGVALSAASGCASSGTPSPTAQSEATMARRSANVITAAELSQSGASNLYLAVQNLRPHWLRGRPRGSLQGGAREEAVVYLDHNRYGNLNSLTQLSTGGVVEIRYLDASDATNRYGTGHGGGAILVVMSKP